MLHSYAWYLPFWPGAVWDLNVQSGITILGFVLLTEGAIFQIVKTFFEKKNNNSNDKDKNNSSCNNVQRPAQAPSHVMVLSSLPFDYFVPLQLSEL